MSNHPQMTNLRSASAVIKAAASIFSSNPISFLFLSFLLFSFRSVVENGSYLVASYIDRDPSLKSLLSRIDLSGAPDLHHRQQRLRLRRHRPFLHLTRVGTLDEDFSSEATAADRSPFSVHPKNPPNGTLIMLSNFSPDAGFSPNVVDNGIRFQEIVRPGIRFKAHDSLLIADTNDVDDGESADEEDTPGDQEIDKVVDFQFFIKGLELGHRDAAAFLFLVSFLSVAYGWVILGFLVTYSWVLGAVFVASVNDVLGRFNSLFGILWDGSRLGLRRLSGFILMMWAVRDAMTQLLGLWFFGEIEDQYSFFKLFVRLKLIPFSVMLPWVRGFEKEISGFLFMWFLIDTVVSLVFAMDAWIAIVDSRKSGREIVKEGCYLILTMMNQAVQLKCLEAVTCGTFVRWFLARSLGKVLAAFLQSTMEVFFMVAWLLFYLGARCKDANSEGRSFELRELEAAFQGFR